MSIDREGSRTASAQEASPVAATTDEAAALHDRVMGLRGKLAYFYGEMKKAQQQLGTQRESQARHQKALGLELIRVADSFEDVFRAVRQDHKLSQDTAVIDCFAATYDVLLEVMESQGLHRVPLEGKAYHEVEFGGVSIPEPWSVIGAAAGKANRKVVREVVRALWVRMADGQVSTLRRGQVSY